jgi:hypothetical protein
MRYSAGDLVEFGFAEFFPGILGVLLGVRGVLRFFGGVFFFVRHVSLLVIRLAGLGELFG